MIVTLYGFCLLVVKIIMRLIRYSCSTLICYRFTYTDVVVFQQIVYVLHVTVPPTVLSQDIPR